MKKLGVAVPLPRKGEAGPGTSVAALARFPPGRPSPFVFRPERESAARIRAMADSLESAERCPAGLTGAGDGTAGLLDEEAEC